MGDGTPPAAGEPGEHHPPLATNESISSDIADSADKTSTDFVPGGDVVDPNVDGKKPDVKPNSALDELTKITNISAAADDDENKIAAAGSNPSMILTDANDENNGSDGSDDDEVCAFDLLASKKSKKKKMQIKPIPVSIALPLTTNEVVIGKGNKLKVDKPTPNVRALDYLKEEEEICYDFDFPDDDSQYQTLGSQTRLHPEEAELLAEKEADVAKIHSYLKAKWDERTKEVQHEVNKLRVEMLSKQKRQRTQLDENHKRQLIEDEQRMDEGLRWLKHEQKKEYEAKMLKHKEDLEKGEVSEESMEEWNTFISQLQARHQEQIKQFQEKKNDLKKKAEKELNAQSMILTTHHQKRQDEADRHVQNTLAKKCLERQEQLKSKLFKLHTERYEKKLLEIRSKLGLNDPSNTLGLTLSKAATSDDENLSRERSGSIRFDSSICHHAVARHKRRKISTNNASFGMSVEIHNEGIIIMTKSSEAGHDHMSSGPNHRTINVFLPWGAKARKVLHSVMCGEIPSCSEISNIHYSGKQDLDGGMVRCMVSSSITYLLVIVALFSLVRFESNHELMVLLCTDNRYEDQYRHCGMSPG